jgi:gluconolactonase
MTTGWQPAQSYPDPAIITLDPRFDAIKPPMNAAVEQLYTGCRWSEGPVWFGEFRSLLWSDFPNNRILKWRRRPGRSVCSASPRTTPTATRDQQGARDLRARYAAGDPHRA